MEIVPISFSTYNKAQRQGGPRSEKEQSDKKFKTHGRFLSNTKDVIINVALL